MEASLTSATNFSNTSINSYTPVHLDAKDACLEGLIATDRCSTSLRMATMQENIVFATNPFKDLIRTLFMAIILVASPQTSYFTYHQALRNMKILRLDGQQWAFDIVMLSILTLWPFCCSSIYRCNNLRFSKLMIFFFYLTLNLNIWFYPKISHLDLTTSSEETSMANCTSKNAWKQRYVINWFLAN